jgi:hypothetical protein
VNEEERLLENHEEKEGPKEEDVYRPSSSHTALYFFCHATLTASETSHL